MNETLRFLARRYFLYLLAAQVVADRDVSLGGLLRKPTPAVLAENLLDLLGPLEAAQLLSDSD